MRHSHSQVVFACSFVCMLRMRNAPGTRMHLVCVYSFKMFVSNLVLVCHGWSAFMKDSSTSSTDIMTYLQGVQDQIDALAADLKNSMKKELQDSGALCQAQFADLCNQLADKKAQINTKTEMYQKVCLTYKT